MTAQFELFLAAGVLGGIVNAAAGGAKLFIFPMLLAAGLPPLPKPPPLPPKPPAAMLNKLLEKTKKPGGQA